MGRDERTTCRELIDPALDAAGWVWDREVLIGPGRVNLSGESMYDESQKIVADYLLRFGRMPLAILEAKREEHDAADGMQQGSRYADRLSLRFSIASNGHDYIVTDNETGEFETLKSPPSPEDILRRCGYDIDWDTWRPAFDAGWHVDQVTQKKVRPYQEMAIFKSLCLFGQGCKRVLLLMATGTGKTFTVFQLIHKLTSASVLPNSRVLFLTDRNSLKDQAYRTFNPFGKDGRVVIDKNTVSKNRHLVGKVFFANYQNLDEELDGRKLYEHYPPDFFDLVVVDECHRSGFGDWFGVLEHFGSAFQLGLTATPRDLDIDEEAKRRVVTDEERRRDTYDYFGDPAYTYSLRQAIEDGYLVPYLLEERISNLDENGYTGPDGRFYATRNFERDIRLPDRTRLIAEDLYAQLTKYGLRDDKTIVFCVDDTHAAFMAAELRRISGDDQYAARITRSERNSHQLEKDFAETGRAKPRVAVTVDLLTTGFDAPDVKNICFARPLKSSILYKQMKGRGTRLCEDIDKRYFTIWDYTGASTLEDSEFDGHPANIQKSKKPAKKKSAAQKTKKDGDDGPPQRPVGEGVHVFISSTERYVCLADGRKIPFDEYREQSRDVIRSVAPGSVGDLLKLWVDRGDRDDLRHELQDRDIHISAFRHFYELFETDDVDVLSKVGYDLTRVPSRHDRVVRFWDADENWLLKQIDEHDIAEEQRARTRFWQTGLDHYQLYGIDDLEKGSTYNAPQFVNQFGSFSVFLQSYGGAAKLRADLEAVKAHLYVPMVA